MRLLEQITEEYVDKLKDDCMVFVDNLKTLENGAQYRDLNLRWRDYVDGYLSTKIGKSIFGIDTNRKLKTTGVKAFEDFAKWAKGCLMVDVEDRQASGVDFSEDADSIYGRFADGYERSWALTSGKRSDAAWQELYQVLDAVRDDKYARAVAKIDKYFASLAKFSITGKGSHDKFVTEDVIFDGVLVHLEYAEAKSFGFVSIDDSAHWFDDDALMAKDEEEFIHKAMDDLRKGLEIVRKSKFGSTLKGADFTLSTVDPASGNKNEKGGTNYGTGGFYRLGDGKITLLKGRLLTYSSWAVVEAVVHELGHKFYYERMNAEQRGEWEKFFRQLKDNDYQDFSMRGVFSDAENIAKVGKSDVPRVEQVALRLQRDKMWQTTVLTDESPEIKKFTDPEYFSKLVKKMTSPALQAFVKECLHMSPSTIARQVITEGGHTVSGCFDKETRLVKPAAIEFFAEELSKFYVDKLESSRSSKMFFPSKYGAEDPSEFFAETFLSYCIWDTDHGRDNYTLVEPVFAKFIDVTRVRSGLLEAKGRNARFVNLNHVRAE